MDLLKSIINLFTGDSPPPEPAIERKILCPACNNALTEKENLNVKIYFCNDCNGFFIPQSQMKTLLEVIPGEEWPEIFQERPVLEHTFDRSKELRKCPFCLENMDNTQFQYSSGIWIDYCPVSHGIWLDGGELYILKNYGTSQKNLHEKVDKRAKSSGTGITVIENFIKKKLPPGYEPRYRKLAEKEWPDYCYKNGMKLYKNASGEISIKSVSRRGSRTYRIKPNKDYLRKKTIAYGILDGLWTAEEVENLKGEEGEKYLQQNPGKIEEK